VHLGSTSYRERELGGSGMRVERGPIGRGRAGMGRWVEAERAGALEKESKKRGVPSPSVS
jgi:hypothetical protein